MLLLALVGADLDVVRAVQLEHRLLVLLHVGPDQRDAAVVGVEGGDARLAGGGVAGERAPVERVGAVRFDSVAQGRELHLLDAVRVALPRDAPETLRRVLVDPIIGSDGAVPEQVGAAGQRVPAAALERGEGTGPGDRFPIHVEPRVPPTQLQSGWRGQRRGDQDAGGRGRARAGGVGDLCADGHLAVPRRLAAGVEGVARECVTVDTGRADVGAHRLALHGDGVGQLAAAGLPIDPDERAGGAPEALRLQLEPQPAVRAGEAARGDRRRQSC